MAYRLLLVEDDPMVRQLYDIALSNAGFDVRTAKDGTIVYETMLVDRFDLVILDIMMPNYNGLQTLKEIKKDWRTSWIPVIILSALDDPKIVKRAHDLGAAQYLVKGSVDPNEVATAVTEELSKVQAKH